MADKLRAQGPGDVFALDIGTRSIIGVVGRVENDRLHVTAIESRNHGQRAMLDGQIEDIDKVASVARAVLERLETQTKLRLSRVCVAAAGRALRSETGSFTLELPSAQQIREDTVSQLESGAVSEAEQTALADPGQHSEQYYMVGYTVAGYRLDGYPMQSLRDHSGRVLEVDVVATFLPREVVDSLYAVVGKLGLEVASLTLEPIASLNAAIPADIRLLNLVLVDIGAGTSDIAVCRDGSVVGYTMATVAGDEVTELLMRSLLVDFNTGERLKMAIREEETVSYTDILGLPHDITAKELKELVAPALSMLAKELAKRILELNGRVPSAVFLAGGGSKLTGLREAVAAELKIDPARVAIAGNHFARSAFSEEYDLNDPEYATPLGIAISAGLGLINDSYVIELNGAPAKLFRSGVLNVRDILLMNGYRYADLIGRTGANLTFSLNGERMFVRGGLASPPEILLNGEQAELGTVVRAGDKLKFTPAAPGQDASRTVGEQLGADFAGEVTVNGVRAPLDMKLHTGDDVWADLPKEKERSGKSPGGDSKQGVREEKREPGPPIHLTLNGKVMDLPGKETGEPYYLMDMVQYCGLDFDHLEKMVELFVNGVPGQFAQRLYDNDDVAIR